MEHGVPDAEHETEHHQRLFDQLRTKLLDLSLDQKQALADHPDQAIRKRAVNLLKSGGALPDPDLIIRTGGERRLSDFLLFESAYAELFFTETYWPDFSEVTLDEALAAFARRQRRYGRTSNQVASGT